MRLFLLAAACLFLLPASARAVTVGIADQHPASFDNRLFRQLPIDDVRVTAPWDGWQEGFARQQLDTTLGLLKGQNKRVVVVIGKSRYHKPFPSPELYRLWVTRLIARHRWVHYWSPYNEANFAKPLNKRPELAARYGRIIYQVCQQYHCQVISPSVIDRPNLLDWSLRYRAALPKRMRPMIWLLHNYLDANFFTFKRSRSFLKAFSRHRIWLGEVGGLINGQGVNSQHWPKGLDQQLKVFAFLTGPFANEFSNVEKIYLYQWQAPVNNNWDSGILDPQGSPRPIYYLLKDYLANQQ